MDSRVARQAGAQFEALLLERVLSPLQRSFGQLGEVAVDACARSIARQDAGGFGALVAAALDGRRDG